MKANDSAQIEIIYWSKILIVFSLFTVILLSGCSESNRDTKPHDEKRIGYLKDLVIYRDIRTNCVLIGSKTSIQLNMIGGVGFFLNYTKDGTEICISKGRFEFSLKGGNVVIFDADIGQVNGEKLAANSMIYIDLNGLPIIVENGTLPKEQ